MLKVLILLFFSQNGKFPAPKLRIKKNSTG